MGRSHQRCDRQGESVDSDLPLAPYYFVASADGYADAARARFYRDPCQAEYTCDICDSTIEGEPAGRGLLLWAHGDLDVAERRVEEPPLCESCAAALGVSALRAFRSQEEEDG